MFQGRLVSRSVPSEMNEKKLRKHAALRKKVDTELAKLDCPDFDSIIGDLDRIDAIYDFLGLKQRLVWKDTISSFNARYDHVYRILKGKKNRKKRKKQKVDYKDYLKSDRWQLLRTFIHTRDGDRCMTCNSKKNLHVHHRTYSKIRTDGEKHDLILLCAPCHKIIHENRKIDGKIRGKK